MKPLYVGVDEYQPQLAAWLASFETVAQYTPSKPVKVFDHSVVPVSGSRE